jgi:hypothetical protein
MTEERWFHIVENHEDLAGLYYDVLSTIEEPDFIVKGYGGALIALREMEKGKFLAVVYKETGNDGFVITAYLTRKLSLEREEIVWRRP